MADLNGSTPDTAARLRVALTALAACAWLAGAAHAATPQQPGAVFKDCPDCPEMVVVPPGKFTMGFEGGERGRYEGPVRDMEVRRSFAAGRTEVTNGQYRRFVTETGHVSGKGCNALKDGSYKVLPGTDWSDPGYGRPIREDEPVACIDWNDAKAYAAWLAQRTGQRYRLLSETEWEYAARAGRMGRFTFDDPKDACRESNVFDQSARRARPELNTIPAAPCDDGFPGPAPVGSLAPNAFGLHDMIGNVWEWVEDCYVMTHTDDAPRDGSAQVRYGCDRRGSRGGSWVSSIERQRPAFRGRDPAELTSQIFGLRIARDL